MALHRNVTVRTLADYVKLFSARGTFASAQPRWYRGEGRFRNKRALLPSIARAPHSTSDEWAIYQRFRQNAAAFLPHMNLSEWDWMLYMRHFSARTRLLDWTESPLVALYFAVVNEKRRRVDGVVWSIDPVRLNELAGFERRVYCAGIDTELDVYTPSQVKAATEDAKFKPAALITARSFPRLVAQQGVFTVIHRNAMALDSIDDDRLLAHIRIPAKAKARIRAGLRQLGVNRLSLYPELQSVTDKV